MKKGVRNLKLEKYFLRTKKEDFEGKVENSGKEGNSEKNKDDRRRVQ